MTASGEWVRYGRPAELALREQISACKDGEPLAPVTVVVASNQVGVSVRRQLASGAVGPVCGAGAGLISVSFLTPYRLAELLGASVLAAEGRRPVSTPVLAAGVRGALTVDPGSFAPVAAHPATESALVGAYRELRDLDDADLDRLAASGLRTGEVVRVARAARARLAPEWYDEEDLMAAAVRAVTAGAPLGDVGALVVHLPQRLSRHAAYLLTAVGSATSLHVLAGSTGVTRADVEVTRSVSLLGVDVGAAPVQDPLEGAVGTEMTTIRTASDADEEVRAAVRTVVDAVRDGRSMDRIAVLHAAPEPYGRLLHDHFAAAGITTNGSSTVPLAARVASRTLLGLLELPTTGFRRQDVMAWITGAPIVHDGRPVPATAWEQLSRDAGVVAGPQDWDERLQRLADGLDERADRLEAEDDAPTWRIEKARSDAGRARALRAYVLDLVARLDAEVAPRSWSDRSCWASSLLADVLGGSTQRDRWPEDERRAADRLELALDRLSALDRIEPLAGLDVFTRTLGVELESDLGRVGRFGEGVLLGPVSMGVGVDLDLLVLVGLAEGTFPAAPGADSLLPDEDRDVTGGALALRTAHVDRLHHQFLATLAGSSAQVLSVPRGDLRRSRERVASRWVLDVASSLAGERWWSEHLLAATAPWLAHVASYDAGLRAARTPATAQEHRLRRLLSLAAPRSDLHRAATTVDAALAAGVEALDARRSGTLTRFDGNIAGSAVPSPVQAGTSTSRLESWAKCPFDYFLSTVLGVKPVEAPEDALEITALDRGNLLHLALEKFLVEAIDGDLVPAPDEPWATEQHLRLLRIADDLCADLQAQGLTGRPLFWRRTRRQITGDLLRFLHADDVHRRATGARPVAAELPFGLDGAPAVPFVLPDGRSVPLRGRADRVDRTDSGTLLVLDYKSGSSRNFKGLSAEDPHQGGRRLQLAVYGQAARQQVGPLEAPVRADYWFASSKEDFEQQGYVVTDEVLASVGAAMATIVEGIEAGLFPARPKVGDTSPWTDCTSCDPDGLGTTELGRQWDHKAADPVVAAYVALAEPERLAPPAPEDVAS